MFIHERDEWPRLTWDQAGLSDFLAMVRHRQGRLIGAMNGLGFPLREEASLETLTRDVLKTSEIEGEILDRDQVRSSIARRLGLDIGALTPADRDVDGVVEMMLDATQHYDEPITEDRLYGWHASVFPTGRSGMTPITAAAWRDDRHGPMQVVSGPIGKEKIHYEAPGAARLGREVGMFLEWFNRPSEIDPVLKAALAHFWVVTIHPFDDGNGRIARAVSDMALARAERSTKRFYSMSAQIRLDRKDYYRILEKTQKGGLDVTPWMRWFLDCLDRAIEGAEATLGNVLKKAGFWKSHGGDPFNDRQRKIINRLLDGFEGRLTSSKWARLAKCSQDTAGRDINDLATRGILRKNPGRGRSTSYSLVEPAR